MRSNFGKYDIPPTLLSLIDLQNALVDPEQFYAGLNFYLSLKNFRYFNTPCDVVVFGNIGVDGIHYGFLTDYGSVADLEVAPIVCVCPMDFDRPTRIVANNLREFLRINMTDGELFYNYFDSEEDYIVKKEQWKEETVNSPYLPSENERIAREKVTKFLSENLQLPIIEEPYRYLQNLSLVRQRKVSIQTQDGLGVTTPLLQGEKHISFPIQENTDPNLELLKEYLFTSPVASRLELIRDIQLHYVLQDYPELQGIVVNAMIKMDLIDEAKRLMEKS